MHRRRLLGSSDILNCLMKPLVAAFVLAVAVCPAVFAQQVPQSPQHSTRSDAAPTPSGIARWLDLQTLYLGARYRAIETSSGVVAVNEVQDTFAVRGRLRLDPAGRFTANFGVGTGGGVTSGWNSTGIGTGLLSNKLSVRQLYAAATPIRGVNVEYGGIAPDWGETTEVTNVDNDTYLVGGRISVKRPKAIWLDEATISLAYLGDFLTPNVFSRFHRLSEINYRQYLVGKNLGKLIGVSVAYDRYLGVGTVRTGIVIRSAKMRVVDAARFEEYTRLGAAGASGFGLYGEKRIVPWLLLAGGYADIDAANQVLNGDKYLRGSRLYTLDTFRITRDLSVSVYFTHSIATDFPIANASRFDVAVTYSALRVVRQVIGLR